MCPNDQCVSDWHDPLITLIYAVLSQFIAVFTRLKRVAGYSHVIDGANYTTNINAGRNAVNRLTLPVTLWWSVTFTTNSNAMATLVPSIVMASSILP